MKSSSVTVQTKAIEQYFPVAFLVSLYFEKQNLLFDLFGILVSILPTN